MKTHQNHFLFGQIQHLGRMIKPVIVDIKDFLKKVTHRSQLPFNRTKQKPDFSLAAAKESKSRREVLKKLAFLPFLGGFAWTFLSPKESSASEIVPVPDSCGTFKRKPLEEMEGEIPRGKLGNKSVSRLILGSNPFCGYAHSRDLKYTSSLFRAYFTKEKLIETIHLAEQAGINTLNLCTWEQQHLINQYNKQNGSNLHTMMQVRPTKDDLYSDIDRSIDLGVDFIQIRGVEGDIFARDGDAGLLQKCVDHTRRQGYPVSVGAHDVHTFYACDEAGIETDFYFKTLHHDRYWSALSKKDRLPFGVQGPKNTDRNPYHDNMWCLFPEETINHIQKLKKPVVGFKVLAGGAIFPDEGFQYAFDNGADFICVGMCDFQIVENANAAIRSIEKANNRQRPWYG